MTSLVELSPLVGGINLSSLSASYNKNKRHRHILKSKHNTLKLKCNRALKRKLKKYKLRQDGQEDQDILDISDILVRSLLIRSPNNSQESVTDLNDTELWSPKNYLFKMISKKQINGTIMENENCKVIEKEGMDSYSNSQEKKQMNAFQLLMDSRNKIIGCNSPGKEKTVDETLVQEILENKNIKAKRILVLQKMAEAKGSIKTKEIEEYKEKYIKKKLEKRADKFKSMLSNQNLKTLNQVKTNGKANGINEICTNNQYFTKSTEKETKSLQLINIFANSENLNNSNKEKMSEEDKEFLKKLSPPLKKKENMLSYFKKIDKDSEFSFGTEDDSKTIKVKLTPKIKKKEKKKKLKFQREIDVEKDNVSKTSSDVNVFKTKNKEKQKRKRSSKPATKSSENDTKVIKNAEINDSRPKRILKKPVKYLEELYQSSSDEDLHIFTPKKKRLIDDSKSSGSIAKVKNLPPTTTILLKSVNLKNKLKQDSSPLKKPKQAIQITKKSQEHVNIKNKAVKLAPIFNAKENPDLNAIEAKQKFLYSGVPDQLKQLKPQQKNKSVLMPCFGTVVHVQQKDTSFIISSTKYDDLSKFYSDDEINGALCEENLFETMLNLTECECNNLDKSSLSTNVKDVLQYLKEIKPRFPIYRTYHMLRGKKKGEFKGYNYNDLDNSREVINGLIDTSIESPDQLPWSDRYKATSSNQIIGNFESINELKKWLVSWKENQIKSRDINADSDLSDFFHSDSDSGDDLRKGDNLIILTGPVGSGKTSSVYAVAAELAIKVIEVNASNKRTGKIMLQDLQEATQSHKVNRGASSSENSQKLQENINLDELKIVKKRGRPKKCPEKSKELESTVKFEAVSLSQEVTRTDSSLILIDDADVVFEQDDGFSSAIIQLVQSSKRPVILVVSTLSCQHLQRFLQNGKILRMYPLSPKLLGMWLDIMSLADTGFCFPGAGKKFLNHFKGDIRKSINTLQFYMSTQSQTSLKEEVDSQAFITANYDNENSSMSWVNSEDSKDNNLTLKNTTSGSDCIWNYFIHKECNLSHLQYPLQIFNIWWSLHSLISGTNATDRQTNNKSNTIIELQSVANAIDDISLADYFNHSTKTSIDVTSDPWSSSEIDNISEVEDLSLYVRNYETNAEICHELLKNSITATQKAMGIKNKYDLDSPGMGIQRERDRIVSRHNNLSKYLNLSAVLDRKVIAVDYWPFCRTLCQIEKRKTDGLTKRKNRFCHYLKSLNMLCKNESFEQLSYSLCFNKK